LITEKFLLLLLLSHHNDLQTKSTATRSIKMQKMIWATRPKAKADKKKGRILLGQNPESFRGCHLHLARQNVLISRFITATDCD
jgi:hypothetical protein